MIPGILLGEMLQWYIICVLADLFLLFMHLSFQVTSKYEQAFLASLLEINLKTLFLVATLRNANREDANVQCTWMTMARPVGSDELKARLAWGDEVRLVRGDMKRGRWGDEQGWNEDEAVLDHRSEMMQTRKTHFGEGHNERTMRCTCAWSQG
jgi:hypothetical protein